MKAILAKLNAIMAEVDRIEKDGSVAFGATKYKYASEKMIKETLHPLLVKHGVIFTPEGVRDFIREGQISSYIMRFAFRDVATGEELFVEVPCSGHDTTDKGPYKAITGAVKYALTTTFLIPTGDDPEKDNGESLNTQTTQKTAPATREPATQEMKGLTAVCKDMIIKSKMKQEFKDQANEWIDKATDILDLRSKFVELPDRIAKGEKQSK
jgi:hypothetical protein